MDIEQLKADVRQGRIAADRLADLLVSSLRELETAKSELETAKQRIQELEAQLQQSPTVKLDEPYSVASEEKRQAERQKKSRKRKRAKGKRRGRIRTADKIAQAVRTEPVYPEGVAPEECWLSHTRPVWRLEGGQAVLVAYDIYRGPKSQYGKIPGVLGRSEFGLEIIVTIAHLVYIVGLSLDKVCLLLNFFQNLKLRKSQADALLNQLSRHWEDEFETLCTLLANSAVVHADETSWSLNSVWAFLSEQVRLLFFGVPKDAATLAQILDPATFSGILISDDAAVYRNFTQSQKCWAHLLRKAIKLTLLDPEITEYRRFTDRLLEIYRKACRVQRDKRFSEAGRAARVGELDDEVLDLVGPMWAAELPPHQEGSLEDYRLLCNEIMRLMLDQQLFVFVTAPPTTAPNGETQAVAGTNNESERTLRGPAAARATGRTNKKVRGARRQTVITSVLESTRQYLLEFTLTTLLAEIERWTTRGRSCFTDQLNKLKRAGQGQFPETETSVLDALLPLPTGN
jgi:transposase